MRATLVVLSGVFVALTMGWAVPSEGAAHFPWQRASLEVRSATIPSAIGFREADGRGLMVKTWVNGRGPFTFAIDTGAGISVITETVALQASVKKTRGSSTILAGLSGRSVAAQKAVVDRLALGWSGNAMPNRLPVAIANLPADIDGILDPVQAFSPLGFVIDYPAKRISAFNPHQDSLDPRSAPADGATVRWYRDGNSQRPFVKLGDGRLALIDTGSEFGLAISQGKRLTRPQISRHANDVGGGAIRATRVAPSTINIGALVLTDVPTDLLDGVEKGAPVILGRDALYPFRLTFDPVRRLIQIDPTNNDEH